MVWWWWYDCSVTELESSACDYFGSHSQNGKSIDRLLPLLHTIVYDCMSRARVSVSVCAFFLVSISLLLSLPVFIVCPFSSIFPFSHFLTCLQGFVLIRECSSLCESVCVSQKHFTQTHTHSHNYSSIQRGLKFGKMSVPHSELNGTAEHFLCSASRVCLCVYPLCISVCRKNWGCALHISRTFVHKCTRTHKWKSKQYFIKQARTHTHIYSQIRLWKNVYTNDSRT